MKSKSLLLPAVMIAMFSCAFEPDIPGSTTENGIRYSTFDFATTYNCDITLDLGGLDYVSIYAEDPTQNPDAQPMRTVWTNSNGYHSCIITMPKANVGKKLYAETSGGVISADITAKGVNFRDSGSASRSESITDELLPDNNLCIDITKSYLAKMNRYSNNLSRLVETGEIAIETKEDNTQVAFTFLHAFGWNSNYIYYYYYKGDDPVTEQNRDEFINKFCNDDRFLCTRGWGVKILSYDPNNPGNVLNDKVEILTEGGAGWINARFSDFDADGDNDSNYYDDSMIGSSNPLYFYGENYELPDGQGKAFPAGYKIGLIMKSISHAEKNKLTEGGPNQDFTTLKYLFSNPHANPADQKNGNRIHVGRFWTSNDANNVSRFVYGFEDSLYGIEKNPDYNFTDFLCMVSTNPQAVTDNIAHLSASYTSDVGTMIYEDNFPAQGDYDMNDVIVEYHKVKEVVRENQDGKDVDIIKNMYVDLIPVHYGATYSNHIYVQCHDRSGAKVCDPQLANFGKELGMDLKAVCNHNEREIASSVAPKLKTLRLYLIKDYVPAGRQTEVHYDVNDIYDDDMDIFLYVSNTNREVHVTNQRHAGVGSQDGLTEQQKLYKAQEYMNGFYPWAMKIPLKSSGMDYKGFIPVTETIQIIYEYLGFGQWVGSNGAEAKDWYLNEKYTPYTSDK